MPVALSVPDSTVTGKPFNVSGTGWQVDSPVLISIHEADLLVTVTSDGSGDFDILDVITWKPSKEGKYTIEVDDGTDTEETTVQVFKK